MQSIVRWLHEALEEPRDDSLRQRLRMILIAWLFGSTWLNTISGATMTKFARAVEMPEQYFGILAALPYVMCLTQIPASWATAVIGGRKKLFLWFVVGGRFMWVMVAAVPWLLPGHREMWPSCILFFIAMAWAGNQASTPAWIGWMSDIIPKRLRGRYFGVRQRLGQIMAIVVVLAVGYVLDITETAAKTSEDPHLVLKVTSTILAIAALLGMLDGLGFQRLRDPVPVPKQEKFDFVGNAKIALRDKNFRRFLGFQFFLCLGLGYIGQYIWLYVFDIVGLNNKQANLVLLIVPVAVYAMACPFWGSLIDRIGRKPVLIVGIIIGAFGAIPWIFIGHHLLPIEVHGHSVSIVSIVAYIVVIICMFAWPAIDIAVTNLQFSFGERRDDVNGRGLGGTYIAIHYIFVAIGGSMSGLIGFVIAKYLNGLRWAVPSTNLIITYHSILFALALVFRLISLTFVIRMKEPRAMATRQAFWYMTNNVYSNTRDMVAAPAKMFDRVIGWTYRMNPPRR